MGETRETFSPGRIRPRGASAARFRAPHASTLSCALQQDRGMGSRGKAHPPGGLVVCLTGLGVGFISRTQP